MLHVGTHVIERTDSKSDQSSIQSDSCRENIERFKLSPDSDLHCNIADKWSLPFFFEEFLEYPRDTDKFLSSSLRHDSLGFLGPRCNIRFI